MSKLNKMASKDASKWASAEMFFGEGAGTRRRLVRSEVEYKMITVPGYKEAFEKAYYKQDMAEHAINAAKERKRLDRGKKIKRNGNAIIRGRKRDLTPVAFVLVSGAIMLHETGYDKVLLEKAKIQWRRTQLWWDDFSNKGESYENFVDKTADVIEDFVPMGVVRKMTGQRRPKRRPRRTTFGQSMDNMT